MMDPLSDHQYEETCNKPAYSLKELLMVLDLRVQLQQLIDVGLNVAGVGAWLPG